MLTLKLSRFADWARKEGVTDAALCAAAGEIEAGLIDARLGGFLIKKRVAKGSRGKSGGLRTILAHRHGSRLVFLYGFAKNERDNIDAREKRALLKLADIYMALSDAEIGALVSTMVMMEVDCDAQAEGQPNPR
jgi:hypothetical protein